MCSLSWNVSCSTGESAICLGGLGESCYERFHWSVSRRRRDGLLFPPVSERHPQSQRDRTENGLLKQRRNSFICSLSSRACVRTARRRGGGVRASGSVTTNNCPVLRSIHVPRRNLESTCCRLRRYSSQHQRRWRLASRITVSFPLSSSDSVDVHARHPAWHATTERPISTSHSWHHSSISKEVPRTERPCHASSCSHGRAEVAYTRLSAFYYISVAVVDVY